MTNHSPHIPPESATISLHQKRKSRILVVLIGLLLGLQAVTTDLYLPALPLISKDLNGTIGQAQLTLTSLLLAFGFSQLIWGPVSDRHGRRPVLLLGMLLYSVAALMCMLSSSIENFILWRMLQGSAMGAAIVCARAILRDAFTPAEGPKMMSQALTVLGFMAVLSPLSGGWLVNHYSWQASLGAVMCVGIAIFLMIYFFFEESLAKEQRSVLAMHSLYSTCKEILHNRSFLSYAFFLSFGYAGLFTYLAASSFVFFDVYGFSKTEYGFAIASISLVYIFGTFFCRFLLSRFGLVNSVRIGALLALLGGTSMGILAMVGFHSWWAFLIPQCIFSFAHSINQPCAQAGVVAPFPRSAGTAAALSGCISMLFAFGVGHWLGWRIDGTVYPLVNGVWFWSVLVAMSGFLTVHNYGKIR